MIIVEIQAPSTVDDEEMASILSNVKLRARVKTSLLLDITGVRDYDMAAHRVLVAWTRANVKRIDRIAVLTDHPIWDSLASVLSKESGVVSRTFPDHISATAWLEQGRS